MSFLRNNFFFVGLFIFSRTVFFLKYYLSTVRHSIKPLCNVHCLQVSVNWDHRCVKNYCRFQPSNIWWLGNIFARWGSLPQISCHTLLVFLLQSYHFRSIWNETRHVCLEMRDNGKLYKFCFLDLRYKPTKLGNFLKVISKQTNIPGSCLFSTYGKDV